MSCINSYFIEKLSSGIIHLLINTEEKWEIYHRHSNAWYLVGKENLKIDESLFQFEKDVKYLCTEMQDTDQISFYYIPYSLIWEKGDKNIIHEYKNEI